ncbi:hypothetical protein Taro_014251 [Colocasia esculenta]|uniref:Endoplasmic reticulum transmembrane protein n=1 Tax=Colocasia esculenta TaxID=4460 RepID=A0A843UIX3_COLES|nr:hypothetical protein [Colocasia esculenta]
MIPLLFLVLFAEGAVAFLLMVKIGPLRELTMKGLDQLKTGKGPATMKTLACTVGVIFLSSLVSIVKIQNKDTKLGTVTPMDQVLWRTHLLEASLTGYTLFLALDKRAEAAEAHVLALQKQSEDLLLEYDRLLEDNQILQSHSVDRERRSQLSEEGSKPGNTNWESSAHEKESTRGAKILPWGKETGCRSHLRAMGAIEPLPTQWFSV